MEKDRLSKQLEFILEIDKEKEILRQSHKTGGERENDAEHAWHMAIMIYLLREYANDEFDLPKAMVMALIHDIVEIDAGDTYAYDTEGHKTRKAREDAAAERIFGLLPEDQRDNLHSLFDEFEEGESPEARFVRAMDNLQPIMLNNFHNGADWKRHGITKTQVVGRQKRTEPGSRVLWNYIKGLIDENVKKGNIIDE